MAVAAPEAPAVQVVDGLNIQPKATAHRNTVLRTVEFEDPRDGRRFRLGFSTNMRTNHYSPRHRHTFDQIRFLVAGRAKYGALRLEPGDCVYFPEGVFYGPYELLSDEVTNCTIQTQGPTWNRFLSDDDLGAAAELLAGKGEIERETGQFRWPDGTKQDSFEAMLEAIEGHPVEYPGARYHYPVLLRSTNFDWLPAADSGVSVKPLATFNATGPSLRLVKLAPGATLSGGTGEHHQMSIVTNGLARYEDRPVAAGTFIYRPPLAVSGPLTADTQTVLLVGEFQARGKPLFV
ncbi:MAG TPA: cupin domain-containing protein [Chloroflexota bacterium]|nr:cupin domain-containing protein [Chloroflexota bacterium]